MAILLNDNLDIAAVKPTDNRYGPHDTLVAAKAAISPTRRYVGLTVGIVTGGTVDEYWFKSGILDDDLVVKTITLTAGATVNTPAGNIAATDVQSAINELDTEKVAKAGDTMTGALILSYAGSVQVNFNSTLANSNERNWRITNGTSLNGSLEFASSSAMGGAINSQVLTLARNNGVGIGINAGTLPVARLDIQDTTFAGSGVLADPVVNVAQTWNTTGIPTAIKLNVTDTASAATSLLMDLQVGGASKFAVDKFGHINFPWQAGMLISMSGSPVLSGNGSNTVLGGSILANNNGTTTWSTGGYCFSQSTDLYATVDLFIKRDAAGILAQRNGINPQSFRLYNTYTDASNYERGFMRWNANVLEIGTEAGGTGVARQIKIGDSALHWTTVAGSVVFVGTSGTDTVSLGNHGYEIRMYYSQFVPITAGSVDLKGTDANIGWGYLLAGHKTLTNTSGFTAMAEIRPTYNQASGTAANTDFLVNRTETAIGSGAQLLIDLQVGGASKLAVQTTGMIKAANGNLFGCPSTHVFGAYTAASVPLFELNWSADAFTTYTSCFAWSAFAGSPDTKLYRESAGVLAQKNGTNPQSFSVYNTSANANVDFERLTAKWASNVATLNAEFGGTGVQRNLALQTVGGNVAIGNVTPTSKLHIYSPGTTNVPALRIDNMGEGNGGLNFNWASGGLFNLHNTGGRVSFDSINKGGFVFNVAGQGSLGGNVTFNSDANAVATGGPLFVVNAASVNKFEIGNTGNVGIGVAATSYKLEVNGSFAATTKSFVIDHPTKPDMKLRYGSLEGPENGVYVRGRCRGNFIELPDYWTKLVDPQSITVSLTAIGQHQSLCVLNIEHNVVTIANENVLDQHVDCFYVVYAERADVDKLVVEIVK